MTAFLVVAMTVLFSLQSLFLKLFSEKYGSKDASLTSTVFSIFYGLFGATATFLIAGLRFSAAGPTILCGVLNAVMLLIYNTAMIQASRTGSYSFQMLCGLTGGIVLPWLHEVIFLGASLSAIRVIAILIMLVAFVLINIQGLSLKGSSGKYLFWCATLAISNGLYSIVLNMQQETMSGAQRNEMVIISYLGMALMYIALQLFKDRKALVDGFRISREPLIYLVLCGICTTIATHLILYLFTQMDAAVLCTFDSGGVLLLSLLYSFILFKERPSKPQIAGMALSLISIIMLNL